MTFNFPTGPAEDQIFTPAGGPTYIYKAPKWLVVGGPDFPEAPNDGKQYARKSLAWSEVAIPATAWADIPGKPATFPPTVPIPEAAVTNLVTDLAALASRATALEAKDVSHDTAISDATSKNAAQDTRLNNLESDTTDWSELTGKPVTFPPTLPIAQSGITNLTLDLAGKVNDSGDTMTGPLVVGGLLSTTTGNHVQSGDAFIAADVNAVLANTGVGNVFLRPQGYGSTTGQFALASTGAVTVTGPVTVAADPTTALQLATKQYVDTKVASAGLAIISDTPPASPSPGQFWFESDNGRTYIWYDDGNSAQWVMVGPTGIPVQPFMFDTNGDVVCKFGASIVIRIKPTGLILTKDDIEIFSVSV